MKTKQKLLNKYLVGIAQHFNRQRWAISSLALVVCPLGYGVQPAHAEGSRELTNSGGDRPHLEFSGNLNAGIPRTTIIKVFANVGETINLGSSANGIGAGAINYRRPNGTAASCSTITGNITSRTQEVAGPLPTVGGYTPCIVSVGAGQGGIWEVDFTAPTALSNPTAIAASANWPAQTTTNGFVTAWDVTVRSSTGTTLPGRAFAKYLSLNMGGNTRSLSSKVTILTRDGYQYSLDANGLDPFGFIFYADDNGFTDTAGKSLYRSIQLTGANPGTLPSGVRQPTPGSADSISDITHKIFFNSPDPSLPSSSTTPTGTTWLYSLPTPPPTASNLQFTGIDNTPGQAGTNLGGNFTFNPSSTGPYRLIIDINQDNILGNGNDRVLVGEAIIGTNTVFWDGKDGSGAIVPPGASFYRTTITFYAGEIHFPLIDAESNPTGIIVERLNNPVPATSPTPNPFTVYFDDRAVNPALDSAAGPTTNSLSPLNGLNGVTDSIGAHDYTTNFGNIRGIDTWAYYPSTAVELAGGVTVAQADFSITKTHSPVQTTPGGPLTYTIGVTNNSTTVYGSSATVTDTLNSSVTGATWTCTITTQGSGSGAASSCANPSGTGNISNAISLKPGGVATFTINATLNANFASSTLSNTATVSRSFDAADPNLANNTATDNATVVPGADLSLTKTINNFNPNLNDSVIYTVTLTNGGTSTATNVQVRDQIPAGITFSSATTSAGTTYNSNTGVWIIPSLASGTSVVLQITGTVNLDGVITNTAEITASDQFDFDSTPNNNVASEDDQASVVTPAIVAVPPNLLLVKRITAINGVDIIGFQDGVNTPGNPNNVGTKAAEDNDALWPSPNTTSLRGAIHSSTIAPTVNLKSGDEVEYTIYFLNNGASQASNVSVCDFVPANQTYVGTGYNSSSISTDVGGFSGANYGITIQSANGATPVKATNAGDGDRGQYYSSGFPASCTGTNSNRGAVVVNLGTVPNATGSGTPANSYGFIRFKAKID